MSVEWAYCQLWNVHGFGLLPPQMLGCYNFLPWEYTLETECKILWVNINILYMKWGVRPCKFVPFITRMKDTPYILYP